VRLASVICASIAIGGAVRAAPMTYDAALDLAHRSAPVLQARTDELEAARASAVAAGRLPDPKLRVGLDNFPVSGPPAWRFGPESMTMASIGVMQDVPSLAKRRAARARAAADIGAADAGRAVESRAVRLNTALAWIDLFYAERRLSALDAVEAAIAPIRRTAPAQLASGAARPSQTLEADQLAAALADRRDDLAASVARARAELARWTGDGQAEVAGGPPAIVVDPARLRADLDLTPSLTAYDALSRQADAELAAARADKRPDWSWDLTYEHRDPRWGEMVSLGATVSLPLFPGARQDPIIAAKALGAGRVQAERQAARRELSAQLDADLADHALHQERLARARATLVPLAQRRADLETASYAAGSASLGDLLGAMLGLAEARVEALEREAVVARDAVRIVNTYGSDAP
jgi:outer membrane protein, heavy metal efflux system